MSPNCGYFGNPIGIFKLFTILLGALSIGLGAYSHFESFYIWKLKEEAFIGSTATCFTVSLFYFLAHLSTDCLMKSKVGNLIDIIFHILSAIQLIIVASLMIESTVEIDKKVCRHFPLWPFSVPCQLYEEKLIACVLCLINGLLYGISAILVIAFKNEYYEADTLREFKTVRV